MSPAATSSSVAMSSYSHSHCIAGVCINVGRVQDALSFKGLASSLPRNDALRIVLLYGSIIKVEEQNQPLPRYWYESQKIDMWKTEFNPLISRYTNPCMYSVRLCPHATAGHATRRLPCSKYAQNDQMTASPP